MSWEIELTATAYDGYAFVKWADEDGETVREDQDFTHTMPGESQELTAIFEQILYELSLLVEPPDGGSVTGGGLYPAGQEIQLTATANEGFVFVKWVDEDGEQVSDVPDFLFTMPGMASTLTANFTDESSEPVEILMLSVPGGTYQRDDDPENITTVSQFHMSVYPITRAQFLGIMGTDPSDTTRSTGTDDPVQRVNWYDAIAFCNKLSLAEGKQLVYGVTGITDWGCSGVWRYSNRRRP